MLSESQLPHCLLRRLGTIDCERANMDFIRDLVTDCEDAGDVFLVIELGLFVVLGLLVPLGWILFTAPGAIINKIISLVLFGVPYACTIYAPYVTWFWLSAAAIVGLICLLDSVLTVGGKIVAGLGVILAFVILDGLLGWLLLMLQADPTQGIGALMHTIGGFTGMY